MVPRLGVSSSRHPRRGGETPEQQSSRSRARARFVPDPRGDLRQSRPGRSATLPMRSPACGAAAPSPDAEGRAPRLSVVIRPHRAPPVVDLPAHERGARKSGPIRRVLRKPLAAAARARAHDAGCAPRRRRARAARPTSPGAPSSASSEQARPTRRTRANLESISPASSPESIAYWPAATPP